MTQLSPTLKIISFQYMMLLPLATSYQFHLGQNFVKERRGNRKFGENMKNPRGLYSSQQASHHFLLFNSKLNLLQELPRFCY